MRKIQFILSVDTEEEWDWEGPFPSQEISVENTQHLPEFQEHVVGIGLKSSYFLDYAVLENGPARKTLQQLHRNHGEHLEYAAHLHPWVTPPVTPVHSEADSHIVNLPLTQVEAQLTNLTASITELTGKAPKAFRSGRWGINTGILNLLVQQGYRVDSSIYPFYQNAWFSCNDYDSRPFWISNLETPNALIELPVSAGFNRQDFDKARNRHDRLEQSPWRQLHLIALLWAANAHRKIYLSPELASADDMIQLCQQLLANHYPVIHMYLHSSSLLPGSTQYVKSEQDKVRLMNRIEHVVAYLRQHCELTPVTITEAATKLAEQHKLWTHHA
ncbi:MAG: polysaccharide deacetylase family protein [Saccharospirillum sp.]